MKHFKREELACNCGCGQDTVDYELARLLDEIREWANAPVTVTSGNRCEKYNKEIGGSKNSQHVLSRAADIQVKGKTPFQVYRWMDDKYPYQYGVGHYDTFTHIDSRKQRARWKG